MKISDFDRAKAIVFDMWPEHELKPLVPKKKLTEAEILAQQCESTRRKMTNTYDGYYVGLEKAQVRDSEGNIDHGWRLFSPEEITVEERRRRASKNTRGQFEGSSPSPERKEAAIQAFTFSPPAPAPTSRDVITGISPIKSETPEEAARKSFWDDLKTKMNPIKVIEGENKDKSDSIYIFGIKVW